MNDYEQAINLFCAGLVSEDEARAFISVCSSTWAEVFDGDEDEEE